MADSVAPNMGDAVNGGSDDGRGSRTILWCVPRSCSTALTKCLSFVEGTEVWFEPFTYCKTTADTTKAQLGIDVPTEYEGNEETYRRAGDLFDQVCQCSVKPEHLSYAFVRDSMERSEERHVFVKDMAYVMPPEKFKLFPHGYKHTFLIRHPLRVFRSFRNAMFVQLSALGLLSGEAAVEETFDIGRNCPFLTSGGLLFKDIYDIWTYIRDNLDSDPIIIDGDDLLANPSEVLSKYCRAVGLPYDESLLKWEASAEVTKNWMFPAEGLVEKLVHLYATALSSAEFMAASAPASRDEVTSDVIRCADEVMKYYDEMYAARLK